VDDFTGCHWFLHATKLVPLKGKQPSSSYFKIFAMKKTVILLGATGLVGGHLLNLLLQDDTIIKVVLFSRRSPQVNHPKIEEHLIDLFQLENYGELFKGDAVFCTVGTTKAKTPDQEMYKRIDYGIPVSAARLAKKNGIDTFAVVSAMGANPDSRIFYNKVKGEMERDVLALQIPYTYVLQPSLMGGNRSEKRTGEHLAQLVARAFKFLIPKRYEMIHPETIAKAMLVLSESKPASGRISSDEIKTIAAAR
jgi:uncharacterized protein YbjT (DUF2867 family)